MILQNGEILGCGNNKSGQLGLGDFENKKKFEKMKINHKIKKFDTFGHHSIMLLGQFKSFNFRKW
jgi:alpha-tubulin suppressor-like RCC1 family protein